MNVFAFLQVVFARGCFDDTKVYIHESLIVHLSSHVFLNGYAILGYLLQGAVLIQNLAAEEPLALGLDTYYKQHYLSLAAAAATIKWCLHPELFFCFSTL